MMMCGLDLWYEFCIVHTHIHEHCLFCGSWNEGEGEEGKYRVYMYVIYSA